jgi:hypothetical protein
MTKQRKHLQQIVRTRTTKLDQRRVGSKLTIFENDTSPNNYQHFFFIYIYIYKRINLLVRLIKKFNKEKCSLSCQFFLL